MKGAIAALALALVACDPPAPRPTATSAKPSAPAPSTHPAATPPASAPTTTGDARSASGKLRVVAASPDADAISLVRTERLKARAEGRVLVVYVSATWCEPCKKLKAEIEAGRLDDRLGRTTLLAFDADADVDRLASAGYVFRYVPFVARPGADGRPDDSQEATGKGGGAWRELLGKLDAWQRDAASVP